MLRRMEQPAARLSFGPFVLDVEQATLVRDDTPLTVQPQVLNGLRYFVENPGRLLSQEELSEALWPGVFVGSDTLFQLIRKIRRALDDAPRSPRYLQTVPRRGYRFVAEVSVVSPAPEPVAAQTARTLFGRQDALRQLSTHLSAGAVVTLTGAGGMGKSHLAAVAAEQLIPCFDDVTVVDLQDTSDADGLIYAVAAALQVPSTDPSTEAVRDRIGRALASRGSQLLVLDDLDRIEDAARALVGRWRRAASGVTWLLTCRRPIDITGERRVALGPMQPSGAQALFCARVRSRGGQITEGDPHLVTLLERLDHSPLAIELAAARTGVMGIEALTRRLDDRFRVLRERHGDRPSRHRSLRACLEGSWHRLDSEQRAALAALSVLPGAFDLGTAEAMLQATPLREDPLDLIEDLHRDALLHGEGSTSGGRRLKLLESVRDYVSTAPDVSTVQATAQRQLLPVLSQRLSRLQHHRAMSPEFVLVSRMLASVLEGGTSGDVLARALWECSEWLWEHGPRVVATRTLARLQPDFDTLSPDAQAMVLIARINFGMISPDERAPVARQARTLAETAGQEALAFTARLVRFTTGSQKVDATEAELLCLLASAADNIRPTDVVTIHNQYVRFLLERGRMDEAAAHMESALEQFSHSILQARLLDTQGLLFVRIGKTEEAVRCFDTCHDLYSTLGWRRRKCISLMNAGGAMVMAGNRTLSLDYLSRVRQALPRIGERRMLAGVSINLAVQYIFDDNPAEALAALDEAEPLMAAENLLGWTGTLLNNRATATWMAGDLVGALAVADQGLVWCRDNDVIRQGALLQIWRAGLLAGLGDADGAATALAAAEVVITAADDAAEALAVIRLHVAACHGPVVIPEQEWGPRGRLLVTLLRRRLNG